MNYQLEHVAIYTKDIAASIQFYEKFFGGHPTPIRKGAAGYGFCFVRIADVSCDFMLFRDSRLLVDQYRVTG